MYDERIFKLWVIKFCLKIIYPKYNFFTLLVYLAIKYRLYYNKESRLKGNMDVFKIKTTSANVQRLLLRDSIEDTALLNRLATKCMIISKNKFIELASENLFYFDNGALWMALKLSNHCKEKYTRQTQDKKVLKNDLNYVTSEIHRKLWMDESSHSLEKIRIVSVVGSKHLEENVALTSEIEYYNILNSFGLNLKEIEISFHPIPTLDCAPKIATLAEVNLLVNEFDLSSDFLKEILSNHFQVPKLLSTNDIFCIDLVPEITGKYHYKYFDLVQSAGKLYFKCKKIDISSTMTQIDLESDQNVANHSPNLKYNKDIIKPYFIVKGVTQLSLGENIHSLKPKDEYFKPCNTLSGEKLRLLQSCPYGLKNKFNQIQESINPFLHRDLSELSIHQDKIMFIYIYNI